MLKIKNLILIAAASILLFTSNVSATGLQEVFDGMISSSTGHAPGKFKSRTRTVYSGGSFTAKAPTSSFTLFSITPPRLSAGCGGISAHFGGFSFINGEEIQQLIKNTAQNAVGLVVQLAIQVGCGPCEDILAKMNAASQLASSLAVDSCQAANMLVNGIDKNTADNVCGAWTNLFSKQGEGSDAVATRAQKCSDSATKWDGIAGAFEKDEEGNPEKNTPLCGLGNQAWCALINLEIMPVENAGGGKRPKHNLVGEEAVDLAMAEILYNILTDVEFEAINPANTGDGYGPPRSLVKANPAEILLKLAQCGFDEPTNATVAEYLKPVCKDTWDSTNISSLKITTCYHGPNMNTEKVSKCDESDHVEWTIKEWSEKRDDFLRLGLYEIFAYHLETMFQKVVTRQAFETAEMDLIAMIPLPLYQLLNLSATFPQLRYEYLQPSIVLLSDLLVAEYFKVRMDKLSNSVRLSADAKVPDDTIEKIMDATEIMSEAFKRGALRHKSNRNEALKETRKEIILNVEQYEKMIYNDIASKQFGQNISATRLNIGG